MLESVAIFLPETMGL